MLLAMAAMASRRGPLIEQRLFLCRTARDGARLPPLILSWLRHDLDRLSKDISFLPHDYAYYHLAHHLCKWGSAGVTLILWASALLYSRAPTREAASHHLSSATCSLRSRATRRLRAAITITPSSTFK